MILVTRQFNQREPSRSWHDEKSAANLIRNQILSLQEEHPMIQQKPVEGDPKEDPPPEANPAEFECEICGKHYTLRIKTATKRLYSLWIRSS